MGNFIVKSYVTPVTNLCNDVGRFPTDIRGDQRSRPFRRQLRAGFPGCTEAGLEDIYLQLVHSVGAEARDDEEALA